MGYPAPLVIKNTRTKYIMEANIAIIVGGCRDEMYHRIIAKYVFQMKFVLGEIYLS